MKEIIQKNIALSEQFQNPIARSQKEAKSITQNIVRFPVLVQAIQ